MILVSSSTVWFLVLYGSFTGTVIIPLPYSTFEACRDAGQTYAPKTGIFCIPTEQPTKEKPDVEHT